ncbi:MAG: von Willebrand factor type A domain-containing protein [Polyangiaceae bacterium]
MKRLAILVALFLGASYGCSEAEDAAEGDDEASGGGDPYAPGATSGGTGTGGGGDTDPPARATDGSLAGRGPEAGRDLVCNDLQGTSTYWMSADDSNSMASPARARELIHLALTPPPGEVRAHEFLNYYDVDYTRPDSGLAVTVEMAAGPGHLLTMLVGVQAAAAVPRTRSLTFVVDDSGSMRGSSLERARAAMTAVAGQLSAGDQVSLVTWDAGAPRLEGHLVDGPDDAALLEAIGALDGSGGSDLVGGLALGYQLAAANRLDGAVNRLVLISDGGANPAEIDTDLIAGFAAEGDDAGIYLVGVGTGPADGYDDALMDLVTEAGRGAYVYLDSTEEAGHVFGARFAEVMDVAARDVRVQLHLPEYLRISETTAEEWGSNPDEIEPQHLAPGDSMSFFEVLSSACGGELPPEAGVDAKVTWIDPDTGAEQTATFSASLADLAAGPSLAKATAVSAWARALSTADAVRLVAARDAAQTALAKLPADADLVEIIALAEQHPAWPAD